MMRRNEIGDLPVSSYALFTSESVSEGHPDKVSDQVSDAILDLYLAKDPNARVAVETLVKTGMAVVAGEVTSSATVTPGEIESCPSFVKNSND